jgi:hypothetical protein
MIRQSVAAAGRDDVGFWSQLQEVSTNSFARFLRASWAPAIKGTSASAVDQFRFSSSVLLRCLGWCDVGSRGLERRDHTFACSARKERLPRMTLSSLERESTPIPRGAPSCSDRLLC